MAALGWHRLCYSHPPPTHACYSSPPTDAEAKGGLLPLLRITDPYAPRDKDDPPPETALEKRQEEKERAAANRKVSHLEKKHQAAKARNASLPNGARQEANWATDVAHWCALKAYEGRYGKFVPDAENKAWFARKNPRIAELYKLRAAAKDIDRHDHVLMLSGHDGLDEHFKQMMHYAWYASWLRTSHKNDLAAMALEAARPLHFGVRNPYPEGHKPGWTSMLNVLRTYASALLEAPDFAALPKTAVDTFQFKARNVYRLHSDVEMVLRGYYQNKYMEDELRTLTLHHWEVWADRVGEKRANVHSPFVPRPVLWPSSMED
ncbi:hypothetical protein B0H19DRAFT_1256313 [Mycena capillaripes]|nr:hypothetical protein B0H19DRAFT_1256313 [Mycena capillaripes]